MKKLIFRTLLILISIIFILQLNVFAAVIVSTDKEVDSGSGNVTISVTSKQALGSYELKLTDTAGLELISSAGGEISPDKKTITGSSSSGITNLGTYTFKVPTVTVDTTYNVKFSISKMETVDLEEIASETNTAVIVVKAPAQKPSTGTQTPTTNPTTPPATEKEKSKEAKLKDFGINPKEYDFSGFSKNPNKEEWSVEVPNSVTEVEIYAKAKDDKATVEGTGKVQLKEGNNEFPVKVTAEDGTTTKTYKLTIKRRTAAEEEAANGEARLKTLGIKKYDFKGFDKDNTQYSAQIPENVKEIEVYATAIDSNAQIRGTGIITLEDGESTLEIEVIAVNGTKKIYLINVIRTEAEETEEPEQPVEEKFGLSKLTIAGVTLNPKFDVETYEYKVDLKEDLTSLQIIAEANDEDATVEIVGNENLQDGENVITILVKNDKTDDVATYQIIVNKAVVAEEIQMSWLKPSTWGKEEIIKIILVIVLVILIICAIALKINISKESKMVKKVDLPGADELDKAIAEHQELVEEDTNNDEIIEKYEAKANYLEEIAKSRLEEENTSNFEVEEFDIKPRRKGKHF